MRQHAADRNVHKQQPQRGISQARRRFQRVKLPANNSAEMVIAAGSVMTDPSTGPSVRIASHHAPGPPPPSRANNCRQRSASCSTGRVEEMAMMTTTNNASLVADAVVQIIHRRMQSHLDAHQHHQRNHPDSKDGLHFAQKMQDPRRGANRPDRRVLRRARMAAAMAFFENVGPGQKFVRHERMDDGGEEQHRGPEIERFHMNAIPENVPDAAHLPRRRNFPTTAERHVDPRASPTMRRRERQWRPE